LKVILKYDPPFQRAIKYGFCIGRWDGDSDGTCA
jgi:hypothetical protein